MWGMNGKLCLKSISKSATNMDFSGATSKKQPWGEKKRNGEKENKKKIKRKNYNS